MVSGLVTSPCDQDKISSGEASFNIIDLMSLTLMVIIDKKKSQISNVPLQRSEARPVKLAAKLKSKS